MTNIIHFNRGYRRSVSTLFQAAVRQRLRRVADESRPETVIGDMQRIVRLAGEDGGHVVKGRINLAARRLNLTPRECERLYYGQRRQINVELACKLYAAEDNILEQRRRRLAAEISVIEARLGGQREISFG